MEQEEIRREEEEEEEGKGEEEKTRGSRSTKFNNPQCTQRKKVQLIIPSRSF